MLSNPPTEEIHPTTLSNVAKALYGRIFSELMPVEIKILKEPLPFPLPGEYAKNIREQSCFYLACREKTYIFYHVNFARSVSGDWQVKGTELTDLLFKNSEDVERKTWKSADEISDCLQCDLETTGFINTLCIIERLLEEVYGNMGAMVGAYFRKKDPERYAYVQKSFKYDNNAGEIKTRTEAYNMNLLFAGEAEGIGEIYGGEGPDQHQRTHVVATLSNLLRACVKASSPKAQVTLVALGSANKKSQSQDFRPYLPPNKKRFFDILIPAEGQAEILRRYQAKIIKTAREIHFVHFPKVADFGVLAKDELIIRQLALLVLALKKGNLFIHCNAGLGRTGLVVMAIQMVRLHSELYAGNPDSIELATRIYQQVYHPMNERRPGSVQSCEQLYCALELADKVYLYLQENPALAESAFVSRKPKELVDAGSPSPTQFYAANTSPRLGFNPLEFFSVTAGKRSSPQELSQDISPETLLKHDLVSRDPSENPEDETQPHKLRRE